MSLKEDGRAIGVAAGIFVVYFIFDIPLDFPKSESFWVAIPSAILGGASWWVLNSNGIETAVYKRLKGATMLTLFVWTFVIGVIVTLLVMILFFTIIPLEHFYMGPFIAGLVAVSLVHWASSS